MTKEELLAACKLRIRKAGYDALDEDVKRLMDVPLEDLRRIGVHDTWLEAPEDPLIIEAVLNYVKANYSITDQYGVLIACYNMTLTKIKGGKKYRSADPKLKTAQE